MKTLVVQKRLPYAPQSLSKQAGTFIQAVRKAVREAKERHRSEDLELADIGFIPGKDFIEIKIYFRSPAETKLT